MLFLALLACSSPSPTPVVLEANSTATPDCAAAKNTCPDYAPSWVAACPEGARCLTFENHCTTPVALAYTVGCNGDGTPGAPQCVCTDGPVLAPSTAAFWVIVDSETTSCIPSWQPPCLTAGLAVVANPDAASCASGTRVEFTAGNSADPYARFDSYDIDVEKTYYSVPVSVAPDLSCAHDTANHDCRPLWCDSATCPDAYATPTTGGCSDGRSPQVGCQDTFNRPAGLTVEFCPVSGESCQDATACPG